MAFIDDIRELAESVLELKDEVKNEAETKQFLIEPFIHLLGYKDLPELRLEYTADVGEKQGEKVDYAIFKDGSPAILIECKATDVDLNNRHTDQLRGYFQNVKNARFGVLTNGLVYQFYTDLDDKNLMDPEPFLEFKLSDIQEPLVVELEKFTKAKFDADNIWNTASELKYIREIKRILTAEYEYPTEDFVRFCIKAIHSGEIDDDLLDDLDVRERFAGYTKLAFQQFVTAQITEHPALNETDEVAQISATDSRQSNPIQADDKGWQPLSEFNPEKEDPKPTEILFPDSKSVSIETWKAILVEVVRWLINNNKLNERHRIVPMGPKRYLVATSPKHSNGKDFDNSKKIGSFYIETSHNRKGIAQKVRHIIKHVDQDPARFKVR